MRLGFLYFMLDYRSGTMRYAEKLHEMGSNKLAYQLEQ